MRPAVPCQILLDWPTERERGDPQAGAPEVRREQVRDSVAGQLDLDAGSLHAKRPPIGGARLDHPEQVFAGRFPAGASRAGGRRQVELHRPARKAAGERRRQGRGGVHHQDVAGPQEVAELVEAGADQRAVALS